jgi:hypothetical protein
MEDSPKENLENLKARVRKLEKPNRSSPVSGRIAWPLTWAGLLFIVIHFFSPGGAYALLVFGSILLCAGIFFLVVHFTSAKSEEIEAEDKAKRIRERSGSKRCIYLEGKIPDGKGTIGRCRRYEFDMVEHPYCLYCREYTTGKGSPRV